jgi:signal-transduction protein with cAMP-binding, CBS, and nucleotidyltransferase domain
MVKAYHKGQVIYSPGEVAHSMYVMRVGTVRLDAEAVLERVNKWPKSPKINEISKVSKVYQRTLRVCNPGDVFGEVELLENTDRKCFATCIEESLIFVIRKEDVDEIFTEREKVKLKSYNQARPPSAQIRNELEAEQNTAFIMRNALLDGIQANFIPSSRSLLFKDIRKQNLAQLFIQRHKLQERKKLIRQRKSVATIDRIQEGQSH